MIESFYNSFISWCDAALTPKYWYLYSALFAFIVVLFITAPNYFAFTKEFHVCGACVDFQAKINRADHLLKPTIYPDNYHMAKTQFRITVALIAKMTGIRSRIGIFIIQQVLGFVFFAVVSLLTFRITNDRLVAVTVTLSFGFIYAGKAAIVDTVGFKDSFAYCFLLISLFIRNRTFVILSLLLAFFTDERAIVSSSFIAIFFLTEYINLNGDKINWDGFYRSRLLSILISWAFCFTIRFILYKVYGLHTPSAGASTINVYALSYIFWDGLKGFWLIIIGGGLYLLKEKRFFVLSLISISMVLMIGVTAMVDDVTRSVAYVFPIIFLALYFFEKGVNKSQLRKIVMISCLVSFLSADSFYIVGGQPVFYRSLPVKIIERLFFKNDN